MNTRVDAALFFKLKELLGLPNNVTWFKLECGNDQVPTVECRYFIMPSRAHDPGICPDCADPVEPDKLHLCIGPRGVRRMMGGKEVET